MSSLTVLIRFACLPLALCALFNAAQAQQTPATFSLVAMPDLDGNDGSSEEKAFRRVAIELFLDIQDETPSTYAFGGYQAQTVGGSGTICPGNFQFFNTENRNFFLKHPRVLSGTILVRVTGLAQEAGFPVEAVEGDFYITRHPNGCTDIGAPIINFFTANEGASSAPVGSTVRLSAGAFDDSAGLNFFFFASSAAGQRGLTLGAASADGCVAGCNASWEFRAPAYPTPQFLTVQVQDTDGKIDELSLSLDIVHPNGSGSIEQIPVVEPVGFVLLLTGFGVIGAYYTVRRGLHPG